MDPQSIRVGPEYQADIPALLSADVIARSRKAAIRKYTPHVIERPVAPVAPPKRRRTEVEQLLDIPIPAERTRQPNPWEEEAQYPTANLEASIREGQLWCPWRVDNWADVDEFLQTAKQLLASGRDEVVSSWLWECKIGRVCR
jgi:hypothetical protein